MTTNFKTKAFRCKKIREMAKGEACTHCGANDGTIVAAHQNGLQAGRGMGMKAHDFYVAYLCSDCHDQYDSSRLHFAKEIREIHFLRAMQKTMAIWVPRLLPSDWE